MAARTLYDRMAWAMTEFEGYFEGSKSWVNHNPGNLKAQAGWQTVCGVPIKGRDDMGHAQFFTFEDGWRALTEQVKMMFDGRSKVYKSDNTLYEVFEKYSEGNSVEYAQYVAQRLGASPRAQLTEIEAKNLVV